MNQLHNAAALTFDCYGTIVDWQTGITAALSPLFPSASAAEIITAFGAIERERYGNAPLERLRAFLTPAFSSGETYVFTVPPAA